MTALGSLILLLILLGTCDIAGADENPDALSGPVPVLNLPGSGADPMAINYAKLPTLKGELGVVNQASLGPHATTPDKVDLRDLRLNLHNYLIHHDGKFWCIWSDGPKVEDWPTQEIKYSTSEDGLIWNGAKSVTGTPQEPHAFIARGLWVREGELLALGAHYREKGAFGDQKTKQLELLAYRYNSAKEQWELKGKIYDNAINNFPPQRLPSGEWIFTRRDSRFNVSVLIGGRKSIDDWQAFPVVDIGQVKGFRPDEPIFWPLADAKTLFALYRDNGGSQRLFHSTSTDLGRSWSRPVLTNFPNATSKLYSMQTSRGYRVLVLNANPSIGRRELHLAVSADGKTFTRLARLEVPSPSSVPQAVSRIPKKFNAGIASLQYPHVIEHEGHLLIALSRGKVQTEVFRVQLDDIDALLEAVPRAAAPPKEVIPKLAKSPEKVESSTPRTVLLKEEDWLQAPLKPVEPAEIDALVAKELQAHNITPEERTTDEHFIRRVTLDLTGQLPRPSDVIQFIADTEPDKRTRLIDQLLETDAWARHWARFWRDVVTARITNRRSMGLTRSFEEWLYEQLRDDKSWDQITRSILTAEGELRFSMSVSVESGLVKKPGWQPRPTSKGGDLFFLVAHDTDEAEQRAAETSRVFLGLQIQCAQCHNHFTEPWKRVQFHELAAYFSRIKFKQLFDDKKLSGVQLVTLPESEHKMTSLEDPESSSVMHPRFLDGRSPGRNLSDRERRQALADVIVDKQNYWFAAAYVNRVWRELMGRSFYPNVDDLGPKKEVVYAEVLTRLAGAFRGTEYDVKAMFRAIANSETYQRRTRLGEASEARPSLAAACPAPLRADVLWDSLEHVLGDLGSSQFHTRGGKRFNTSILEGKFKFEFDFDPSLKLGEVEGTIPQSLFLMNNIDLNRRIQAAGSNLLGRILKDSPNDEDAVKRVYLRALARTPTDRELARCRAYIDRAESRAEAFEDILWALINSTEFQTKR